MYIGHHQRGAYAHAQVPKKAWKVCRLWTLSTSLPPSLLIALFRRSSLLDFAGVEYMCVLMCINTSGNLKNFWGSSSALCTADSRSQSSDHGSYPWLRKWDQYLSWETLQFTADGTSLTVLPQESSAFIVYGQWVRVLYNTDGRCWLRIQKCLQSRSYNGYQKGM